jgi:hypothetical protein
LLAAEVPASAIRIAFEKGRSESISTPQKTLKILREEVGKPYSWGAKLPERLTELHAINGGQTEEVLRKTGKKLTRAAIWRAAGYRARSEFERWERNDSKYPNQEAHRRITTVLTDKPHLKKN